MTAGPPVDIPPSVGGTGLAAVAGLMLGRLGFTALVKGQTVSLVDWLTALGALAFVALLLSGMLLARKKMGVNPTPSSIRRQWMVVAGGVVVGLFFGIVTAM